MTTAVNSQRRGSVLEIELNRPDSLNAINPDLVAGVIGALETAASDDVRAVSVRGAGRGFCAGGDIRMFRQAVDGGGGVTASLPDELHRMIELIRALPKPVVALVHGPCAGAGMSLAIACDLVVAADNATFNLAYTGIGLSPDGSSTYFLPRHIGLKKATELFFAPQRLSSADMLDLGLINQIAPADQLLERGRALVDQLAAGPTRAYGAVKALLGATFDNSLHDQLALETEHIVEVAATDDFAEGVRAFLDKRFPRFHGR